MFSYVHKELKYGVTLKKINFVCQGNRYTINGEYIYKPRECVKLRCEKKIFFHVYILHIRGVYTNILKHLELTSFSKFRRFKKEPVWPTGPPDKKDFCAGIQGPAYPNRNCGDRDGRLAELGSLNKF